MSAFTISLFALEAERDDAGYDAPSRDGRVLHARMAAAGQFFGDEPGSVADIGMGSGRLCVDSTRVGGPSPAWI